MIDTDARFFINDPSKDKVENIYSGSDFTNPSHMSDDRTYKVVGFDENDFYHVQLMTDDGKTFYADYRNFKIEGFDSFTLSKYEAACWEAVNSKEAALADNTYYNQQNTDSTVTDDDGDEIVKPSTGGGELVTDLEMSALMKTFGMPPQWTKYVDPRVYAFNLAFKNSGVANAKCALGRRFFEVTISRPTIIEIAPGRIYYPVEGSGGKEDYINALNNFNGGSVEDIVNDERASFFTIKPCYNDSPDRKLHGYISYVSVLMRVFASFLSRNSSNGRTAHYYSKNASNIKDIDGDRSGKQFADRPVPIFNVPYKEFTWHQYDGEGRYSTGVLTGNFSLTDADGQYGVMQTFNNGLTEDGFTYIRFFGLNGTRSSDTFDTQITDTDLASKVQGLGSGVRDAAFFISGIMGDKFGDSIDSAAEELKTQMSSTGQGGIFSTLLDATAEVIRGGKITFPKIIDDCDYGKSMSIECIFTAVYGDQESIYLNTYAGLAHILAMALPHQVKSSLEIYTYPYIVKAFSKGIFNCPMGVVSGLTIDYAGESGDMWSVDSVPSEIKVSFQITPLITKLALTSENDASGWLLRNNGLQEYIATIAGSDLRADKTELATELLGIMLQNQPAKMETNALQRIYDWFWTSTVGRVVSNIGNVIMDPDTTLGTLIDNIL